MKIRGLNLPDPPTACAGLQRDSFSFIYINYELVSYAEKGT
jgi:hypothetical protein